MHVFAVMWQRWQSQHIQSAIAKNSMMHANFTPPSYIEPELLPIKVLHCGNKDFCLFCSCELNLDLITFICGFYLYSLKMYWLIKSELSMLRLSRVIVLHIYEYIVTYTVNHKNVTFYF